MVLQELTVPQVRAVQMEQVELQEVMERLEQMVLQELQV